MVVNAHLSFRVALLGDEHCWEEGYLNSGNVGSLHSLVVSVSRSGLKILSATNGASLVKFQPLRKRLDRFGLADRLREFYELDPFILSEILFIGSDSTRASEELSDEGLVVVRHGEDHGSETSARYSTKQDEQRKELEAQWWALDLSSSLSEKKLVKAHRIHYHGDYAIT